MAKRHRLARTEASNRQVTHRRGWTENQVVRRSLVVLGFVLIALTPIVGPIPGPGGVVVFAAGAGLVLKYSGWAKRAYVRFKRRHPKKGDWTDWSLRRPSARRRHALRTGTETGPPARTD